ncbi:MAG: hypothetical protein K9L30_18875 [Desulfobacterales bacterium]|nr:hypothetical protein [Desulfobacterales bacterium]
MINKLKRNFYNNLRTLFNVSFAILLFMPTGWSIIISILLLEVLLFYLFFKREYGFKKLLKYLAISNLISGIVGFALSMFLNGGWLGVFWFPWVSSYEMEFLSIGFDVYFISAFLLTLIVEIPINIFLFRKIGIKPLRTINTSILVNIITNIGCAFVMYIFSFNLIN